MLILSRRPGESIIVDGDIKLTILSVKGSQIRIGFDAPDDVSINRQEIHDKIVAEGSVELNSGELHD